MAVVAAMSIAASVSRPSIISSPGGGAVPRCRVPDYHSISPHVNAPTCRVHLSFILTAKRHPDPSPPRMRGPRSPLHLRPPDAFSRDVRGAVIDGTPELVE